MAFWENCLFFHVLARGVSLIPFFFLSFFFLSPSAEYTFSFIYSCIGWRVEAGLINHRGLPSPLLLPPSPISALYLWRKSEQNTCIMLTLGGPEACSQFEEALLPFPVKIPQHNRHWRMVSFWKIPLTGRGFKDPGPQWHFEVCVPKALQDGLVLLVLLCLKKDVFTGLRGRK